MSRKLFFVLFVPLLAMIAGCTSTKVYDDAVYNSSNVWRDLDNLLSQDFSYYQATLDKSLRQVWEQRADKHKVSNGIFSEPDKIVKALLPKDGLPDKTKCNNSHGVVLLLHGLYDAPYTMTDLGKVFNEHCLITRYLLLPGHGAHTGDLRYTKMEDWLRTVRFAVKSIKYKYSGKPVYIAGFSTGGALAINQALADDSIQGLFLFAPVLDSKLFAVEGASLFEMCCEYVEKNDEKDSIKYESTTANSVIQVGYLVERIQRQFDDGRYLNIPVFVILAKNDYTVPASMTIDLFKDGKLGNENYMLVYSPEKIDGSYPVACHNPEQAKIMKGKITVCNSRFIYHQNGKFKINDYSHMALTLKPDNHHYGLNGQYQYCLHYGNNDEKAECLQPKKKQACYGERRLRGGQHSDFCKKEYTVIRRLTANPLFPHLKSRLSDFIDDLIRKQSSLASH